MIHRKGLPPVINSWTRVLIVGTFPSQKSLEMKQYYANLSRNQFWKVMSKILPARPVQEYDDRIDMLLRNRIGLWDVIESCIRPGNSDSGIRSPIPNKILRLLKDNSGIKAVVFNGRNAKIFAERLIPGIRSLPTVEKHVSTSTSGANTHHTLNEKVEMWKELLSRLLERT